MSEIAGRDITVCIDAYPDAETDVFRIGAADDILRLLADAHETEFTVPELVDATDVTRSTVWRAVDLLESIDAVRIRETPQRNDVSIDPDRLRKGSPPRPVFAAGTEERTVPFGCPTGDPDGSCYTSHR